MKRIFVIVAAICVFAGTASAQQPNTSPIVAHYRAYQAALEREDLAAAEASAAEALAAAEAVNDARAGALAFNLATVRFTRNNANDAIAPARRALELAELNPDRGVSPDLARLMLARVELAVSRDGAADRVHAALETAQTAQLSASEISDGAVQLAIWANSNERNDLALAAWTIADTYAEGSRFPLRYARAQAKLGRAVAITREETRRARNRRFNTANIRDAVRQLREAHALLDDLALQDLPSGEMTLAQQTYAQVLAWSAVISARLRSEGSTVPRFRESEEDADGMVEEFGSATLLTGERCLVDTSFIRPIYYPHDANEDGELAGAAVRLRISESGEVEDATVVAVVGSAQFVEAINQARWRVTKRRDSPPHCRMQMSIIRSISFARS